jgi:benzoate-CoA ligase family protein
MSPAATRGGLPTFPDCFNLARYLLDARVEEGLGDRPAVHVGERTWSYREVQRLADRTAAALADAGVRPEERVLIALPDVIEFVASWFGILKAGAVFAMANTILPEDAYAYYLGYTRAPVAIVHEDLLPKFAAIAPRAPFLRKLLVVERERSMGDGPTGAPARQRDVRKAGAREGRAEGATTSALADGVAPGDRAKVGPTAGQPPFPEALRGRAAWFHETLAAMPDRFESFDSHRDDVAGWLFTSGSTGHPKAAVHSHEEFAFNIETYAKRVVGYRASELTVSVPKLFFGYATGTNLMFPFAVGGATALFPGRSTPEKIFEMIERHRPTLLTSVPTMINAMLQLPGAAERDLSCLRVCLSAGEALPVELYHRWMETFGVEILDGIGSAEMFHIYISNQPGEVVPGSLGRVVEGYEARIVGADGADAAEGETGTLWIRGGSTARGYWLDREKSRHTFRGDWCVTGDLFRRDGQGLFWYGGRADDLLKVSGIFVTPLEIEDCLYGHAAVRDVCVVGAEDDQGLTRVRAYVTLKEGHAPGEALALELKALAKEKLAPYKYPRWFSFVAELPRNDRGKVQRKLIREGCELTPLCEEIDVGSRS